MMKKTNLLTLFTSVGLIAGTCTGFAAGQLDTAIDNALQVYSSKAEALANDVLVSSSTFTDYSNTSGVWAKKNRGAWTSGFVPGIFWNLYKQTGDAKWKTYADKWTGGASGQATDSDNDTGFQIYYSSGLGYELTGKTNSAYLNTLTTAMNTFDTQRFNPTIGCYRSWTNTSSNPTGSPSITDSSDNPNDMIFEVNIDQMMNLELVLYVGKETNNQTYIDHAVAHADRTWETHVRPNGSTYHVAGFNADGTVRYHRTHQGWNTDSTWSRGQAWAVYGYAMVYRYTGLQRMLDRAEACLAYFLSATANQSNDTIPYSDFDAPLNSQNPRDTSAAAVVASALLDLYKLTGQQSYLETAEMILADLTSATYLSSDPGFEPVLMKGSSKWGASEVGTIFGDYYLLESLVRYEAVTATEPPPVGSGNNLVNISTRGPVGEGGDIMIGGFVVEGQAAGSTVLIRGVGPSLSGLGVANSIDDPVVRVFREEIGGASTLIAENDDWADDADIATAAQAVGAFGLMAGSRDAALLLADLPPGAYTVQLSGKASAVQVGLLEIYRVE